MAMSKKHYEKIAEAVSYCYHGIVMESNPYNDYQHIVGLVDELCDIFEADNPKFDSEKFRQAVYYEC